MKLENHKNDEKTIMLNLSKDKMSVSFDGFGYDAIDIDDLLECIETLIADVLFLVR